MDVYAEFKMRYGAIKIQRELSDRGIPCSVNRVQRHMRHHDIKSIVIKKYPEKRLIKIYFTNLHFFLQFSCPYASIRKSINFLIIYFNSIMGINPISTEQ